MFTPMALNATAWMETTKAMGAKHAILTTQAGCGFDLWFTNATLPGGARYNYTVRESPFKRDIVREFVDAARAAGAPWPRPSIETVEGARDHRDQVHYGDQCLREVPHPIDH